MDIPKADFEELQRENLLLRQELDRLRQENIRSLRQSEERYRQLVESANSIIVRWNPQGILLFANEYALKYFGYTREELIGKNVMVLVPEMESSGRDLTGLTRDIVENPQKYTQFENENICKNGERVWVSWSNKAVLDEEGNVSEILGIGNDITPLKKVEEELRNRATEIEAILSCIPDGVIVYDTQARIVFLNQAASNFLKYGNDDLKEAVSERVWKHFVVKSSEGKVLKPEEMPAYKAAVDAEYVKGQVLLLEGHGESRWFIFNAAPLMVNGAHMGGVLAMLDVTAMKETERLLHEKQQRFEALADNISQMVWIADSNGKVEWFNKRWDEYTGVSLEALRSGGGGDIHPPDYFDQVHKTYYQSIHNGIPWEATFPMKSKEGEYRWFLSFALPIRDTDNNVSLWFGSHTDITELRNAKEELEKQNIELIEAKEKAEESDRLKTAFLANISHEIRTPMTGILGFADLLKDSGIAQEEKATYLKLIETSGQRMLQIINDLIDISKVEAGQLELKLVETNINALLNELLLFFIPHSNKKGIYLKYHNRLPSDKMVVLTDKTKLGQVMSNLIDNAIKYTKNGSVEFGCELVEGGYSFFVKDTGPGIKKELQHKIFDRFMQGELSLSEKSGGVGLGLSISKAYVELLGGSIEVDSELCRGSVFSFVIAAKSSGPLQPGQKNEQEHIQEAQPTIGSKILIAEDDEAICLLLIEIFKQSNIASVYARDGLEAVEKFKSEEGISLVIMDTKMPRLNGLEAMRQIKAINPKMPIIALSAYSSDQDKQRAFECGCDDYLVKPMERKALLDKVAQYI